MSKVTRFTCVLCNKGLRKYLYKNVFLNVDSSDIICGTCRRARCCPCHISDENFSEQALECLSDLRKSTDFNRSDILDLLQKIRMLLLKNDDKRLNFEKDSSLSDAEYISLTGIDLASFNDLATHLVSIRDTKVRSSRTCLDNEQIESWLQKDDVVIVDRGFRDSIDLLDELGIQTEMPSFLKKGQSQFTTEESNTSRLITKDSLGS
ncbi:unnamed protein product [Mytilus coruscus]|uniref:Uncharacterized protein n=1 Tax=Mytilus coruscus TaxID=42192 RepID=A0A6J8AJA5_MYTCO|nr:unnamed protein product [Mytilus coruscus]